jgi:hypothetical protein
VADSGPAVASRGPGQLDVFALGKDNAMLQESWTGTHWSGWQALCGTFTSKPSGVSFGPNRIDLFEQGSKNDLMHGIYLPQP